MTIKKRISILFILLIGFVNFTVESPVNAENQLPGIVVSEGNNSSSLNYEPKK